MISAYQHNQPMGDQPSFFRSLLDEQKKASAAAATAKQNIGSSFQKVAKDGAFSASKVFEDVGKSLEDTMSGAQADLVAAATTAANDPKYNKLNADDVGKQEKSTKNAGNILEMIFKIVPIGMGIVRRLPNVVKGLKDIALGFTKLIVGLAVSSVQVFVDSFQFMTYSFTYSFSLIGCFIDKVLKIFGVCGIIYLVDLFLFLLYALIFSICFMLDMLLMLKPLFGYGLLDALSLISDLLSDVDDRVFAMSSIHIFSYPDWINKACHTCDIDDTEGITRSGKKIKYDFGTLLPKNVVQPAGQVGSGMAKVLSIFAL